MVSTDLKGQQAYQWDHLYPTTVRVRDVDVDGTRWGVRLPPSSSAVCDVLRTVPCIPAIVGTTAPERYHADHRHPLPYRPQVQVRDGGVVCRGQPLSCKPRALMRRVPSNSYPHSFPTMSVYLMFKVCSTEYNTRRSNVLDSCSGALQSDLV